MWRPRLKIQGTRVKCKYTTNLRKKSRDKCKNKPCLIFILQNVRKVLDFIFTIWYNIIKDKERGNKEMKVSYIRVSSVMQNEARQMEAMQDKGIEKYFIEKISAKDTNRPQLKEMLDYVREGDIVYIHDFSRLARSTKDLLDIVEILNNKGVILKSNKENLDTSTPTGKLMLTMIGAINEFERQNLLERQREGIEIAKREKKFKGGQEKKVNEEEFEEAYKLYAERKINKTELAEKLNLSRPTLNRILEKKGLK